LGSATYENLSTSIQECLRQARAIHLTEDTGLFGEQATPFDSVEDILDMHDHEFKTREMMEKATKQLATAIKFLASLQTNYESATRRLFAERVMRPQADFRAQQREEAAALRERADAIDSTLPPKPKGRKRSRQN